MDFGPKANID